MIVCAQVNACIAHVGSLRWLPPTAFDGVMSSGSLSQLPTRRHMCTALTQVCPSGGALLSARVSLDARTPVRWPLDTPPIRHRCCAHCGQEGASLLQIWSIPLRAIVLRRVAVRRDRRFPAATALGPWSTGVKTQRQGGSATVATGACRHPSLSGRRACRWS